MLLVLQILFGALAAGTGIGLIVDVAKNRKDALKSATGKQWASGFTVGIIANFLDTLGCGSYAPSHSCINYLTRLMISIFLVH